MTIACPHCGQTTELKVPEPQTVPDAPTLPAPAVPTPEEIVAQFQGPVPPTPVSVLYQGALLLVTLTMLLLPVIYVGLIVAAGWGVGWYATHFHHLLTSTDGRTRLWLWKLMLYFGPLFVGGVAVLFMIKPLFARRGPRPQALALNPEVEPLLFTFIAKICEAVGAPMPQRIDLDCQLNASASFRRGLWSLLGNDLVLTIGLPLVGGLSLREFAGVIAHEFGHFTQGFGMRLSYVVRSINGWFARVVFERDAWDLWLDEWAEQSQDARLAIVLGCARLAVWLSRRLLQLLMLVGHGVSCLLLHQMEYDADSYEIKLAGSAAFESTMRRLQVLGAALDKAYKDMRTAWNINQRLPDNFPAYLAQHEAALPVALRQQVQESMGRNRTGAFDTHPSDGERVRRARKASAAGIFALDLPATVLFTNFDAAARQVTQLHYVEDLNLQIEPFMLRPVEGPTQA